MASTYVNNLRLNEMATGDASGTWGTTTNTNLEIIGQAVAWGTRAVANASTDNITIADGALDADRCLGLKLTGGGQACTVTLLPNTSSKTWFMYNATAAALTFTCGSGANVIIPAGHTKVIATDGLGSGGVVHDLLTAVNLAGTTTVDDLIVSDDLVVADDASVGGVLGVTGVLTTTAATVFNGGFASNDDSTMGTNKKLIFRDAAIHISSTADGDLSIAADDEIDITSTLIDVNGNLDVSGTALVTGVLTTTAATVFNGGFASNADSTMGTDKKLIFRDSAIHISSVSDGDLMIVADDEIDITSTLIDVNGNLDVSGTALVTGVLTTTAATVFNGGFVANDGSTITTADNTTQLTLISTDADANGGPVLDFYRNSASPADNDVLAQSNLYGNNDAGEKIAYAYINTFIRDASDGAESSEFSLNLYSAGSAYNRLEVNPTETVFNEDSADLDFRVESNGSANALFVDGGNNHVNIMTSTDLGAVLNVSGNAYIQHADNSDTLTLESTDADANAGPNLRLYRSSANPADNDTLGTLNFEGRNDNSQDVTYAEINTIVEDATDGTEDAMLIIKTIVGGTARSRMAMTTSGGTVFNEDSQDLDFRVESNGSQKMLFVDGGNNGVLIDSSNQDIRTYTNLDIVGQSSTEMMIHNDSDTAGEYAALLFKSDSQNDNGSGTVTRIKAGIFFQRDDPGTRGTGKLHLAVEGANDDTNVAVGDAAISITADGEVTMPKTPAFSVNKNGTDQNNIGTGNVTVTWAAERFDVGGNFGAAGFTAPVTGKYQLQVSLRFNDLDADHTYMMVVISTSNENYRFIIDPDFGQNAAFFTLSGRILADMDASDTATIIVNRDGGESTSDIEGDAEYTHFSGFLAC